MNLSYNSCYYVSSFFTATILSSKRIVCLTVLHSAKQVSLGFKVSYIKKPCLDSEDVLAYCEKNKSTILKQVYSSGHYACVNLHARGIVFVMRCMLDCTLQFYICYTSWHFKCSMASILYYVLIDIFFIGHFNIILHTNLIKMIIYMDYLLNYQFTYYLAYTINSYLVVVHLYNFIYYCCVLVYTLSLSTMLITWIFNRYSETMGLLVLLCGCCVYYLVLILFFIQINCYCLLYK